MSDEELVPEYFNSWALIIGISNYQDLAPLTYAHEDAKTFADLLLNEYAFEPDKVIRLTNAGATKERMLAAFDETLCNPDKVGRNDRVIIFFAGHGTHRARTQGYLAPVDALQLPAWRTWISVDSLVKQLPHIPAKHIFMIIDACYGGLILAREVEQEGVGRMLDDLLTRPAWQALTAGLSDQRVADGGGLTGENSIFTAHLLEGLKGAAASEEGILTASDLMIYVRQKVAADITSDQTPLFGRLLGSGDGDFVFKTGTAFAFEPAILQALRSSLPRLQLAAIKELGARLQSEDVDEKYAARIELYEVVWGDYEPDIQHVARLALSSAALIALLRDRLGIDYSDMQLYDQVVAGLEFDGGGNFKVNNKAAAVLRFTGLKAFDNKSRSEKERLVNALVQAAHWGAFTPGNVLRTGDWSDEWLELVVEAIPPILQEPLGDWGMHWNRSHQFVRPLVEWAKRGNELPESWKTLIEEIIVKGERLPEAIGALLAQVHDLLQQHGFKSDLIERFLDYIEYNSGESGG